MAGEKVRFELKMSEELRAAISAAAGRFGVDDAAWVRVVVGLATGVQPEALEAINLLARVARAEAPPPPSAPGPRRRRARS